MGDEDSGADDRALDWGDGNIDERVRVGPWTTRASEVVFGVQGRVFGKGLACLSRREELKKRC